MTSFEDKLDFFIYIRINVKSVNTTIICVHLIQITKEEHMHSNIFFYKSTKRDF